MEFLGKIISGRYRLEGIIAENPIYTRYRGSDIIGRSAIEACVISSTVMSRRSGDVIRFKNIAAKMANIHHPSILRIVEAGEFFEHAFMITERVAGKSLAESIATGEAFTLSLEQKLSIIKSISEALARAHRAGIVHRAISPHFVFVTEENVLLGGFGFAYILEYLEDELEEMRLYLSPEQQGIIRRTVDERSDLYSAGVLLFRLLSGTLPDSRGENFTASFFSVGPLMFRDTPANIPEVVWQMMLRLCTKEPSMRYQSAEGLAHDVEMFLRGKHVIIGQKDGPGRVHYRTTLAGREREMKRLKELFARAAQGRGTSVAIAGQAGCGKSRLMEEFKEIVQHEGGMLLEAKCHRETVNTPYEALHGIFEALLGFYSSANRKDAALLEGLFSSETAACRDLIAKIHPGITRIYRNMPAAKKNTKDTVSHHGVVIARFLRSLDKLGTALVFFIDDAQWIDAGSFDALKELLGMLEGSRVMCVFTSRDDKDFFRSSRYEREEINFSETILLGALDEKGIRELVAGMLSENEEHIAELADVIFAKSAGNSLFAITILKNLVESGAVTFDGSAWNCTAKAATFDIPPSLVDLVAESARMLDEKEKEIIACAAVMGKAFDYSLLSRVVDLPEEEIIAAIDNARRLHIFKEPFPGSEVIEFAHDRIMEVFLERITPERKRALHLKIASALAYGEGNDETIIFELARHYEEGGDFPHALKYLYPAAILARDNYAYRDAARYFQKTIAVLQETGQEDSRQIVDYRLELAAVDAVIGEYDEAIAILNALLPLLERSDQKARAHLVLCQAHYRRGEWKKCEAHAAAGLKLLGDFVPTTRLRTILSLIKEIAVHLVHVMLPVIFVRSTPGSCAELYQHIIAFYEPLGMSYALNEPMKLVRSNIHALNIAERHIGPSTELAMSYYAVGALYMSIPLFENARKYLENARRMNEELEEQWGLGKTLELFGYFFEWQAQYEKALEFFEKAKQIFEELGDMKEYAMVLNGIEHCEYYSGNYEKAIAVNTEYYELVKRLGDEYSLGAALIYFSQYHREKGNIAEAMKYAEEARALSSEKGIWFNYCSALNELGCNAIEAGEFSLAIQFLEEAKKLHEKNTFLKQYIIPLYVNLACAYLDEYQLRYANLSGKERRDAERKILRACREAVAKTANWPTHHAGAIRVMGRRMSIFGKHRKAVELFKKALEHASKNNRRFEEIRTLVEYGNHLLRWGDGVGARAKFEEAYRRSSEIDAGLLVERISNLLGIHEKEERTPFERHLGKERHLLLAEIAQKIFAIENEQELAEKSLEAVMDFTGAHSGCLCTKKSEEDEYKADAARRMNGEHLAKIIYVLAENAKKSNGIFESSIDGRNYRIFYTRSDGGYAVAGVIGDFVESEEFSRKDTAAVMSFLGSASGAMLRLQAQKADGSRDVISLATEQKVQKAIEYIKKNYTADISREGLAASLDINPDHLGKAFKSITGEKIGDYINRLRIEDAAKRLVETKGKIIDIAYAVGFESLSTFNRAFAKILGISPQEYRKTRARSE